LLGSLQLGGGVSIQVASNASFVDNMLDRKSFQGYTIKLFNRLIAWRSSKQDTVKTSLTKAELPVLSQVAKESMFISRLLQEIKLPELTITIQCNNTQTMRLVIEKVSKLQTKLQHVDIHHHLLRQEVSNKVIRVEYVQSYQTTVDRLTKVLPVNKWSSFLEQLDMVETKECILPRELGIEDLLDGIGILEIGNQSSLKHVPS
jgi:hypothetical protein